MWVSVWDRGCSPVFGVEPMAAPSVVGVEPVRALMKCLNGGRDRTRTCDLLRVKQAL